MSKVKNRFFHRLLHKVFLKQPKFSHSKTSLIWWSLTLIYIAAIIYFFFGPLQKINQFDCNTNRQPSCPDFVIPELDKLTGQLIYKADTHILEQKIKSNLPAAEKVEIQKIWPNQLMTTIYWQSPIANLQIPASSSAVLVGSNGFIIQAVDQPLADLPIITASSAASFVISDYLTDDSLITALNIVKHLPLIDNSTVKTVNIVSPLELRVVNQNNHRYLFTSTSLIDDQLHALQLILAQTTINLSDPVYDLRYDRPALKQSW